MHVTAVPCPNKCGDEIAFAAIHCSGCGHQNVGYPNVRYADDPAEVAALDAKFVAAQSCARQDGSGATLDAFKQAVDQSRAITVMSPVDLLALIAKKNKLWVSFYKQTRAAGGRVAEPNKWDMNRGSNDEKVNPQYYEEINYAALSLTDYGSGWYGGCHISLDSQRIAIRTSVFWKNPFQLLKDPKLEPDEMVPPGFRASWGRRGELAVAKLHDRITPGTVASEFADILLERDSTRGDTDFIEVHIYGPVAPSAFTKVTVDPKLLDEDELLDWESVRRRLKKRGVPVKETGIA